MFTTHIIKYALFISQSYSVFIESHDAVDVVQVLPSDSIESLMSKARKKFSELKLFECYLKVLQFEFQILAQLKH